MWPLVTYFKEFRTFVISFSVDNDAAERNVKLVQDFIAGSHDKDLRQGLVIAVDHKSKGDQPKGNQGPRLSGRERHNLHIREAPT